MQHDVENKQLKEENENEKVKTSRNNLKKITQLRRNQKK